MRRALGPGVLAAFLAAATAAVVLSASGRQGDPVLPYTAPPGKSEPGSVTNDVLSSSIATEWSPAAAPEAHSQIASLKATGDLDALALAIRSTPHRPVFFHALDALARSSSPDGSRHLVALAADPGIPRERRLHLILAVDRTSREPARSRILEALARNSQDPWVTEILSGLRTSRAR